MGRMDDERRNKIRKTTRKGRIKKEGRKERN